VWRNTITADLRRHIAVVEEQLGDPAVALWTSGRGRPEPILERLDTDYDPVAASEDPRKRWSSGFEHQDFRARFYTATQRVVTAQASRSLQGHARRAL